MIAAIYARKSNEQLVADEQKSVARQVEHARQYAKRKGWMVDEASVALESAEAAKSKHGFRVRASERRAREEVERREHELVAGHGELAYCGLVHVTAINLDELDDAGADFEQCAARAGVQLRPLEGRHAAAWVAGLPLGRTLASRKNR